MQAAEIKVTEAAAPGHAIPVEAVQVDMRALARTYRHRDRLRFLAAFVVCLLLHVLVLVPLPFPWNDPEPLAEEVIPVELITEPAPEPEPEQPPVQEPEPPIEEPKPVLDEKPATDAARSAEQEREAGKSIEVTPEPKPESAPEPAETQAEPLTPTPDVPAPEIPAPQPRPAPEPRKPVYAPMTPLPQFQFEAPAKRTPFQGGNAEPTYLSTLYGLIMKQMQTPQVAKPAQKSPGRVVFGVGRDGRIFQEAIIQSSGVPELDKAAIAAVRRASPYPPPPNGGPIFIRFDYSTN